MTGQLVQLREEHRPLVHALRTASEQWLAQRGLEQYNGVRAVKAHDDLDRVFDEGRFVGWLVDGQVRAVAALVAPDRDFWTADEADDPRAAYLGRFMVGDHGHGWGDALLTAICEEQARLGKRVLRLDCWRDNTGLHAYYLSRGFRHVRTEVVPERMSGALFERDITAMGGRVVVDLRSVPAGSERFHSVARVTVFADGRITIDDPGHRVPSGLTDLPIATPQGRTTFREAPLRWVRNLGSGLRTPYLVPVIVEDSAPPEPDLP